MEMLKKDYKDRYIEKYIDEKTGEELTVRFNNEGDVFYFNGEGEKHRTDGPAVIYITGGTKWYQFGLLHRPDGPAVEYSDGGKEWWVNGVKTRSI